MTTTERVEYVDVECAGCGVALRRRASDMARLKTSRVFCGRDCPGHANRKPRSGVERACPVCGDTFYRRPSAIKPDGPVPCCSNSCAAIQRRAGTASLGPGPTMWGATCETCEKDFTHPRSQGKRRYCSAACAGNANTKVKLSCQWCGGDYVGRPHERRFCSRPCFYDHQTANAEGTITEDGYRRIRIGGAYILEHRHVMQATLGHEIPAESTVHHKNGNKLDNRPDNLELWASRHPKGQRVIDLLEYARWIQETFGADEARLRELEA